MRITRSATRYHTDLWLLSWLVLSVKFAPQTARLLLVGHMCLGHLLPTWQCITSASVKQTAQALCLPSLGGEKVTPSP